MATWTAEQVLALAPDPGSAKAGRDLASPRKWKTTGQDARAAWGECQGSGKDPYQVQIDLSEPAFKCSCPSRKFPCKHGLGLLLMVAGQPGAVAEGTPPAWVESWLQSRAKRAEQKEKPAEEKAAKKPDPAAQAKRAAERQARVSAGLEELERWLHDRVRQGLASVEGKPYSFWEGMAARMVDAQAPGLARLLREMAGIPASGPGWQERLLDRLARLHLLLEAHRRLDTLPPDTQADVRTLIGWSLGQEEVLAGEGVRDRWAVLAQYVTEEDKLRVQRTWLRGQETGRAALVLQFAAFNQPLDVSLVPGTALRAELVFYPSAYPLRALVKSRASEPEGFVTPGGFATLAEALAAYTEALARFPWLDPFPMPLAAAVPYRAGEGWAVRDAEERSLPVLPKTGTGWELLARSGGRPIALFGEWDGSALGVYGAW